MEHKKEGGTDAAGSVFEARFNARDYIRNYYPPIDDAVGVASAAHEMRKRRNENLGVDAIALAMTLPHELVENIAIFDFYRIVTEHLLEEFPDGEAQVLDIGGGPTIYQHLGTSLIAKKILHSEFLASNRAEIESWLEEHEDAYEWDSYFAFVQHLFKQGDMIRILKKLEANVDGEIRKKAVLIHKLLHDSSLNEFKQHVRSRLKGNVVHGDMFKVDLGLHERSGTFDVVTSNFVAESASKTKVEWESGMRNIIAHVRPGGYLIQTAIKNASWYQVGSERLPAFGVDAPAIKEQCEREGCTILLQNSIEGSNVATVGYHGMIFTLAKKKG